MPKEEDAITKLYDFLLWIIPKLEKFPRSQKFLIADRIETALLDILDLLKATPLRSANLKLEQVRYLIRLSKDFHPLLFAGFYQRFRPLFLFQVIKLADYSAFQLTSY